MDKKVNTDFDSSIYPVELHFQKVNDTTFVTRENRSIAVVNFPSGKYSILFNVDSSIEVIYNYKHLKLCYSG